MTDRAGEPGSAAARPDIRTREDVRRLVRAFYALATTDEVIGPIFTDVARLDLDRHLPVMDDFWESLLLGARSYGGGAMAKHLELNRRAPLLPEHFQRWLQLFERTVEELFQGAKADEARVRARMIARSMEHRAAAARGHGPGPAGEGEATLVPLAGRRAVPLRRVDETA